MAYVQMSCMAMCLCRIANASSRANGSLYRSRSTLLLLLLLLGQLPSLLLSLLYVGIDIKVSGRYNVEHVSRRDISQWLFEFSRDISR